MKKTWIETQDKAQKKGQIGALLFEKILIKVLAKYCDYNNIFSAKNVAELSKYTKINDNAIELEKSKQSSFYQDYSLKLIEFEIFNTYLEINLINSLI